MANDSAAIMNKQVKTARMEMNINRYWRLYFAGMANLKIFQSTIPVRQSMPPYINPSAMQNIIRSDVFLPIDDKLSN